MSQDEKWGHVLGEYRVSKFLGKVCFKLGTGDRRALMIHVLQKSRDDSVCVEVRNPLKSNCKVKKVAALFSLIESAQLGA